MPGIHPIPQHHDRVSKSGCVHFFGTHMQKPDNRLIQILSGHAIPACRARNFHIKCRNSPNLLGSIVHPFQSVISLLKRNERLIFQDLGKSDHRMSEISGPG